ncbi:MAG: hypothetical protein HQL32_17630, partial [Planctomycetes bacterium]|nr:hypothetical protein [Planctomycetota bacterium]
MSQKSPESVVNLKTTHEPQTQALVDNALLFAKTEQGVIDGVSGYPVEGWNHGKISTLSLRHFTQSTSIGEWIEFLALVCAGYVDVPEMTHGEALAALEKACSSLTEDQKNSKLSAKGLMCNFFGLDQKGRVAPLTGAIDRSQLEEAIGEKVCSEVWPLMVKREWIHDHGGGKAGVKRGEGYGDFDEDLEPYAEYRHEILQVLNNREATIIYG